MATVASQSAIVARDSDHVRDRVFEPFFTTRTNGTGLGLAIVKRMIELQDGTVALTDRPEGGTIAEVTIPRPRCRSASALQTGRHDTMTPFRRNQ